MIKHLVATTLLFGAITAHAATAVTPTAVVAHYADIAHALYTDALTQARVLQQRIDDFLKAPSAATQQAAQQAWIKARVPYQQTETLRFGNTVVDDWEGQVNSWPLDEGLIDYVDTSYNHEMGNVGATANIIANPQLALGGAVLDTRQLTPDSIAELNELGGSEANVASGYHAIEFLLWGQDLNGTGSGAGQRPFTDYSIGATCTHGNCDRRAAYLRAVTALLISDLGKMEQQWAPSRSDNYRAQLLALPAREGLTRMLYGMGSLALGELAGERMKVALEANSPEDEHDCFSDNTHNSHYYNALGIKNIYRGEYRRSDGTVLTGPSLSALVASTNAALDRNTSAAFAATDQALQQLVTRAEQPKDAMKFDQMIAEGNAEGERLVITAIKALVAQTALLEQVAAAVGIDNLNPDTAAHDF